MTVSHSLDAYLDPTRLSFSSPPVSDIMPPTISSDESYPVFSPLPRVRKLLRPDDADQPVSLSTTTTSNTLQPGNIATTHRSHRRQSSANTVSWTDQGDSSSTRGRMSASLNPSNVSFWFICAFNSLLLILYYQQCLFQNFGWQLDNFPFFFRCETLYFCVLLLPSGFCIGFDCRRLMRMKWRYGVRIVDARR